MFSLVRLRLHYPVSAGEVFMDKYFSFRNLPGTTFCILEYLSLYVHEIKSKQFLPKSSYLQYVLSFNQNSPPTLIFSFEK